MSSYGTSAGVAALCKHRTPAGDWSESSSPSSAQVTAWLEKGYAAMNIRIARAGYVAPVTNTVAICYDTLVHLNDLYAAAYVEKAYQTARGEAEAETRGQDYLRDYLAGIKDLLLGDGTLIGLTVSGSAPPRSRLRMANMRREDGYSVHAGDIDEDFSTLAAHIETQSGDPIGVQ